MIYKANKPKQIGRMLIPCCGITLTLFWPIFNMWLVRHVDMFGLMHMHARGRQKKA